MNTAHVVHTETVNPHFHKAEVDIAPVLSAHVRRIALLQLAKTGDAVTPVLIGALDDPSPVIRATAAALASSVSPNSDLTKALCDSLLDLDYSVREMAAQSLSELKIDSPYVATHLLTVLKDSDTWTRIHAIKALANIRATPKTQEALMELLEDNSMVIRNAALEALTKTGYIAS